MNKLNITPRRFGPKLTGLYRGLGACTDRNCGAATCFGIVNVTGTITVSTMGFGTMIDPFTNPFSLGKKPVPKEFRVFRATF